MRGEPEPPATSAQTRCAPPGTWTKAGVRAPSVDRPAIGPSHGTNAAGARFLTNGNRTHESGGDHETPRRGLVWPGGAPWKGTPIQADQGGVFGFSDVLRSCATLQVQSASVCWSQLGNLQTHPSNAAPASLGISISNRAIASSPVSNSSVPKT